MKMTRKEKRVMVRRLLAELKEQMFTAIDKAPKEWEGIELRHLFADLATAISQTNRYGMIPKRWRNYVADRLELNI